MFCTCMTFGMRKSVVAVFVLCLTCALFVYASERSHATFLGENSQYICRINERFLNGSMTSSRSADVTPTEENMLPIHVIITLTNAEYNHRLQAQFALTISSLFLHSTRPVTLYVIGDAISQDLAEDILAEHVVEYKYKLVLLDVNKLTKKLDFIIRPMQEHFTAGPGAYYRDALFFLSVAMHRLLPKSIDRVIMLDGDLKFLGDIAELYEHFHEFGDSSVIGIAHEAQPVYRHTFWKIRREKHGTRIGEPPPYGLTGFNSGVLLLDLNRMRQSSLYNSLLDGTAISQLTSELHFKGHLGDQDFFTLIGMRHEQLFYVLPCQWNRQLCRWWADKGYQHVFESYHACDGDIKIYHGNCNTPIP